MLQTCCNDRAKSHHCQAVFGRWLDCSQRLRRESHSYSKAGVLGGQSSSGEKLPRDIGFDVIFINVHLEQGINFSHSFNRSLPHWLSLGRKKMKATTKKWLLGQYFNNTVLLP